MARHSTNTDSAALKALSRFAMLATIAVVVTALYFAKDVLIPVALAVLLTFLLAPMALRLERRRLGRVPSVLIVVVAALAVIVGIGAVVVFQAHALLSDLPTYQENITTKLMRFKPQGMTTFGMVMRSAEQVSEKLKEPATTQSTTQSTTSPDATSSRMVRESKPARRTTPKNDSAPGPLGDKSNPSYVVISDSGGLQWETIENALGPLLSPFFTAGLVIVFTIFMLVAREDLRDRLIRLIGQGKLTVTTQAISDAADRISRYLLMQSLINGSYGLIVTLGLWIIGVPNPLLFGLLCSVLRFLPYVGPLIGMSFPIIVSIGKFSGFSKVVETAGMFAVVELFTNNVMEPWLYGSSTGMSTVAILVAAVFWTWLWGPVGLLLSTPLTVILVVLGKYVPQFAFLDVMLGDEPVLEPHERFYQRLLALDAEEATELAREYRRTESLEDVYDKVILPAIAMSERDRHIGQLDEEREHFLHAAVRDVIDELGDEERAALTKIANEATKLAQTGGEPKKPSVDETKPTTIAPSLAFKNRPRPVLPKDCVVTVVCMPAHGEADDLVGMMLAQLLNFSGYCATAISSSKLSSERVDSIESSKADLVAVSSLPPSAVAHSRYVLKKVEERFPLDRTIVGLWMATADPKRVKPRLSSDDRVHLCTTLRDALEQMHQLAQQALFAREEKEKPATGGSAK